MEIQNKHIVLTLDEETLLLSVKIGDMVFGPGRNRQLGAS